MNRDHLNRFIRLKWVRIQLIIRRYYHPPIDISFYLNSLRGKHGIEIGGPSLIFRDSLPIYEVVGSIDNINHSNNPIWKNRLEEKYKKHYICDSTDLGMIPAESYDFLLSCHSLEHIANPLKAMGEWLRILKHGAYILIIVPDKRFTFDHLRPITSFDHLLLDYEKNMGEDDMTHLQETIRLHDAELDMLSKDKDLDWSKNFQTRRMHHHVFDKRLLKQMADFFDTEIMRMDWTYPYNIIMLARKR